MGYLYLFLVFFPPSELFPPYDIAIELLDHLLCLWNLYFLILKEALEKNGENKNFKEESKNVEWIEEQ